MGSPCGITSFTDNTNTLDITCKIPTNPLDGNKAVSIAGNHLPKVHFEGIGFAITDGLTATSIQPEILIPSMLNGSPAGGTILTIPGRNFGFAMNETSLTVVTVGGQPCSITSLVNTEIQC
jgi:hypothetical protein